jgi:hypothetical protein
VSARRWGAGGAADRHAERGQSLVEFSMIVPVFLILLLGILEMGFAFDHLLTIGYASREGARTGAALANGEKLAVCGDVDKLVVSAVERVLTSDGSPVRTHLADISSIRIYKANSAGAEAGPVSVWTPSVDVAGNGTGLPVDGRALHFAQASSSWGPCGRVNATSNPDSIGIRIAYTYRAVTPLAGIMRFIGGSGSANLAMTDKSVMALNPTD